MWCWLVVCGVWGWVWLLAAQWAAEIEDVDYTSDAISGCSSGAARWWGLPRSRMSTTL
ncbi:hypothetical protein J6590_009186 [Homalodisca vitripennis]|nr:hypothetical protein J6590_009186 [Homalodisca vitripennis]